MTSRMDIVGQNGNISHAEDLERELNPPTSSMTNSIVGEIAKETGRCSDGRSCGEVHEFCQDAYCADCPNDPLADLTVSVKPTTYHPSMAELYPQYYKDVSKLTEVDVYAIHDLFGINDPSGCIQHASKKLLLCGVRTGGKDVATEIKEARDTLTRKLQLMGVE